MTLILAAGAALGGVIRSIFGYLNNSDTEDFDWEKLAKSIMRGAIGGFIVGIVLNTGTFETAIAYGISADVALKEGGSYVVDKVRGT